MKALEVLHGERQRIDLQFKIDRLQNEISLAKERRGGIQAAIDSREKSLARLVAQLALMSPAGQSSSTIAG